MFNRNDKDWNGPQSSEDMGRDKLRKDDSALGFHAPKSILKKVDPAADQDGGYSGKLPSEE
jgi:hypothetical protein